MKRPLRGEELLHPGKLTVNYLACSLLHVAERNARTHSPQQIQQLTRSISEFGWTNPILIDEHRAIVAGHGRLAAAQSLGMVEVPTITLRGLSDAQKRALAIADNKLALNAGWDEDLLRLELSDLKGLDFDVSMIGFSDDELAALFVDKTAGLTDPDDAPDVQAEAVSRLGDVWLLGRHRLVCGDCTDALVVEKAGGQLADMLLTDPPYGIGYEYIQHDDHDNEKNAMLVEQAFALAPAAKVWTPGLANLARDIGRLGKSRVLVWAKKFAGAGNGLGGSSTWEPILVVGRTPARKLTNDVITIMTDREVLDGVSLRKLHTCPKPVALYGKLLESFTLPGQAVYEPFSGSGTTILAAEMTGRSCHAIEISPQYVDVAVRRWMAFTGQQATLESTGATFAETESRLELVDV